MAEVNENIKELELVTTSMSNSTAAKSGCNSFALVTSVSDVGSSDVYPVMCTGLLTDLPSFSISPAYDLSPGKSLLDLYTNAFKKDEFDVAAVLMSSMNNSTDETSPWVNTIQAGALTRGMFKSVSYGEFNLKFKIYTQKAFGQSTVSEWRDLLTKFAVPSKSTVQSAGTLLNNIEGALAHLNAGGQTIIENLKEGRTVNPKPNKNTEKRMLIDWKITELTKLFTKYCNILSGLNSVYTIKFKGFHKKMTEQVAGQYSAIQYTPIFNFNGTDMLIKDCISWSDFHIVDRYTSGAAKLTEGNYDSGSWWFQNATPTAGKQKAVDNMKDYRESQFGENKAFAADMEHLGECLKDKIGNTFLKNLKEACKKEKNGTIRNAAEQHETNLINNNSYEYKEIESTINAIINTVSTTSLPENNTDEESLFGKISKHIECVTERIDAYVNDSGFLSNYSDNRVYETLNAKNYLGEKLWHLYIYYPWLFKRPITVGISEWSITPAKILGYNKQPVYHEIEIKCKMDQIPSVYTWDATFSEFCDAAAQI